ncbi:MAG TPA: hypothetical protein QF753_23370 [Victivallales bacterium]|jgi:hypothetical protein|nr:hypothetical protein [Victivallales bacterium]|tara:strand:+ start:746 stop:967 length:222 start_codon:yes stop_codon:yes gene_type:complete
MYETIAWIIVLSVVSNLFYRKGIKAGIKHSLLKLRLTETQVHSLNEELNKDDYDLSVETLKEVPQKVPKEMLN